MTDKKRDEIDIPQRIREIEGVFIHSDALCESPTIGPGTRVWAFSHILPGARVGTDCNICDHVFLENSVILGDRVTVKCGVQLWDGIHVADDVFIGPNATFCNDLMPRSKCYQTTPMETRIERNASIGANATILPGITIGRNSLVGAGAVVTRSVPPNAIVAGNPAQIIGYADTGRSDRQGSVEPRGIAQTLAAGDPYLYRLPLIKDMRGDLTVGEFERSLPFRPMRYFMVMNVPNREVRGEHAHHECKQLLLCVRGSCQVMTDDGTTRHDYVLDDPTLGLYLPPLTWSAQYRYTEDAILLVFASHYYEPADYIRDYETFLTTVSRQEPSSQ